MKNTLLTMGIDIGSATSKCVIMRGGGEIVAFAVSQGGTGTGGPDRVVKTALETAGLSHSDISHKAATGYGRNTWQGADLTVSELSCHARGAVFLYPDARMVVDIGGQDCKAMKLTDDGRLDGFAMNDKCAAGTGRFLEVMARVLEVDISDLGDMSSDADGIVDITSTCTVFAESEVISQLSGGVNKRALIAGIHRSVAVKAAGIAKRMGVTNPVFFSGGVSLNRGVVDALSRELGAAVITDPQAQLAGAIGACLHCFLAELKNKGLSR
jgi:predicted CoA-substrate-specific enzyme activase